ncbi:hypothetical protein PENTCL1PPCAC_30591, partial [Pristionchus entomophagus]
CSHRMKQIGYRVFPSKHSESIRRSKTLFHYELPTARRTVIDFDYRQYVAPKISHSDYKVTAVPSRVIDEPDYDRDEEERLSGKGTPDRLLPLSRPPSSTSLDRPPHRTNPISASSSPSLGGGTTERYDVVDRRSTGGASSGNINNGERRNTGYYMERERFNGMHGRSHALESMERETLNGQHGRSSAIATNTVDRPQHAATYHPASNSRSRRHTGSSHTSNSDVDPPVNHLRPFKIRYGFDRHPEVRDVIDQSEEILEDLDSMLEEHLSFDEARRKIMDQNLSFRQYAKVPYDDENNYEIIEEVYERRITKEKTIVHFDDDADPRVELHRDEMVVHRAEKGDTARVKDPEVADRMKRLVNGRGRGAVSPPLFQDIIVEDLKKASKHGVREANAHRRRKAEEMYEWTLSEIGRLERALAPEYCIQHIPVYAKDNFTRIPEWKRRLVAKKLSQESIREETHRLWDEFDEWLRVNDPTWKPAHSNIEDRLPILR